METTSAIRLAAEADAARMLEIYAPLVRSTAITFETAVPSEEAFAARIRDGGGFAPWLVAESGGQLDGYAYASRFRPRPAYDWTVEVTVYVSSSRRRRGVGHDLYLSLLACLRLQGFRSAIAVIAMPNTASIRLHESLGFAGVGVFPDAGYKLGAWHDVGWWRFELQDPGDNPARPLTVEEAARTPQWAVAIGAGTG